MKIFAVICLILVLSPCFSIKRRMTSTQLRNYETLKKGTTWASVIMSMAELHTLGGGPLDELIDALQQLLEDLVVKEDKATENFNTRTNLHEMEINRLTTQLDKAKLDISNTETVLQEVLYKQKAMLEEDLENLGVAIETTQVYIQEITANREKAHEEYLAKIAEHEAAIEALNECLGLLASLENGELSLVQTKKTKNALNKAVMKLPKNNAEAAMIKALVQLATGEFADSDAIQTVVKMMVEVQATLQANIEGFQAADTKEQNLYEEEKKLKEGEITQFKLEVTMKSKMLETTKGQIAEAEAFLELRKRDLLEYQGDIEDENKSYEHDTQTYNDLMEEFAKEKEACGQALDIIQSADFAGHIGSRLTAYEDGAVIDQAHGSSVEV